MSRQILRLLVVLGVPLAANAQVTTLDYQGSVMGGTSTVYTGGNSPVSPPLFTTATFDATVTYSGSLAQHDLVVDSYEIDLIGNNGAKFEFQNLGGGIGSNNYTMNGNSSCVASFGNSVGCVSLTTSGGAVTGATINLQAMEAHYENFDLSIGTHGDAFSYAVYGGGAFGCSGDNDYQATFVGAHAANPCTINVSDRAAGAWTRAPELDPASAGGGLTLLLGSLLVLGARRAQRANG